MLYIPTYAHICKYVSTSAYLLDAMQDEGKRLNMLERYFNNISRSDITDKPTGKSEAYIIKMNLWTHYVSLVKCNGWWYYLDSLGLNSLRFKEFDKLWGFVSKLNDGSNAYWIDANVSESQATKRLRHHAHIQVALNLLLA